MKLIKWQRSIGAAEGSGGARETGSGAGLVTDLSVHRTSQGLVRYRRWPGGSVSIELLDEPATPLAWVSAQHSLTSNGEIYGADAT